MLKDITGNGNSSKRDTNEASILTCGSVIWLA